MIELSLKNFQSHRETNLQFDKGVNVIVGVSDSGKSAILRALRWLWTSRPLGDYFVRWGEKDCIAKLEINGNEVIRGKEKKQNYYSVNGKVLEAMKAEVPSEVSDALKLEDINWQGQRDLDFLLSLSPLEASKYIQRLCGLEAVPPILSACSSMELENKRALRELEEKQAEAENKVKAFADFGKVEKLAEELQAMQANYDKMRAKEKDLGCCLAEIVRIKNRFDAGKNLVPKMAEIASHIKDTMQPVLEMRENQIKPLEVFCTQFKNLEARFQKSMKLAGTFQAASILNRLIGERNSLPNAAILERCVMEGRALARLELKRKLLPAIDIAKEAAKAAKEAKKGIEQQDRTITDIISLITMTRCDLRKNRQELEKAQASLPKLCPTCGKSMEQK